MKVTTTLVLVLLATLFLACSGNQNTVSTPQAADPNAPIAPTTPTTPDLSNTPVATAGVQHYICPNNCAGSGGATAGTCPTCGSQYTHNQAYHNQDASTTTPTTPTTAPSATPTTTPITVGGVQHYTCPNNCAGSGGATAGTCPTCGSQYTHNQAYHNQSPVTTTTTTPTTTGNDAVSPLFQNAPQQPQVQVPRITPASNAAGVFHYTCSKGCGGGAGAAGSCPKCGAALAHNQAYHQ